MVAIRWTLRVLTWFAVVVALFGAAVALVAFAYRQSACMVIPHALIATSTSPHQEETVHTPDYLRPGKTTYLTFPEWYIVYSAREYASYLDHGGAPSGFVYLGSIGKFWCSYAVIKTEARQFSDVDLMDHVMLTVIGGSYSAEYLIKSIYENTIGRLSELVGGINTPEDRFYAATMIDYAKFLDETPWYDYPFASKLAQLWRTSTQCPVNVRSCERRAMYSTELLTKALYGRAIGYATHASYSPADLSTMMLVKDLPSSLVNDPEIKIVQTFDDGMKVIRVPRYQEFTELMKRFALEQVQVLDFAGNQNILVSMLSPKRSHYTLSAGVVLMEMDSVSGLEKRSLVLVPAHNLMNILRAISGEDATTTNGGGYTLEHIYDY